MAGVGCQFGSSFLPKTGVRDPKLGSNSQGLLPAAPACSPRVLRPPRSANLHSIRASSLGSGDPIRAWIVGEGGATKITKIAPVGGGCINTAMRYDTDSGSFFVKTNRDVGPAMFEAEAVGLDAMYATGTIRVPKPYKVGPLPGRGSYIIMEHISMGASSRGQVELGRKLAEMHIAGRTDKGFGFDMDNTIGSTPQKNPWTSDWVTFFRDHRLGYQLQLAEKQYRDFDIVEKGKRLLDKLPYIFRDVKVEPCLLHGDLWSGNITADENGAPVILDPACYYGHNEAEFGMSWCAGFGSSFYDAYFKVPASESVTDMHADTFGPTKLGTASHVSPPNLVGPKPNLEVIPKQPGFEKRRELYRLYHYLNHYNLFGSSYRSSSIQIIQSFVNQS